MAPASPRKLSRRSAVSEAMPKALRSYIPLGRYLVEVEIEIEKNIPVYSQKL